MSRYTNHEGEQMNRVERAAMDAADDAHEKKHNETALQRVMRLAMTKPAAPFVPSVGALKGFEVRRADGRAFVDESGHTTLTTDELESA